jgi:diguanylate cyclase (GGDEF)-like protein/PAS domain S-box-containing protein
LHRWTPPIAAGLVLGSIGGIYAIASTILLQSFAEIEQQEVRHNVEVVADTLAKEVDTFNNFAADYAVWDATYEFIKNSTEEYIESDFADAPLLRLNIALFINSAGKTVYARAVDFSKDQTIPFPKSLQDYVKNNPFIWQHSSPKSNYKGIVLLPETPMLIVSQPIVKSNGDGPVRGAYIMGRFLNAAEVQRLGQQIRISFKVYSDADPKLPGDLKVAKSELGGREEILVRDLNEDVATGYKILKDINGKPGLWLRIETPRKIYQEGLLGLKYLRSTLLIVGLMSAAIVWLLLAQLARSVRQRDRIQQELFQEQELAQITLHSIGDGVIATDVRGQIESLNPVAEKLTGWKSKDAQGLPVAEVLDLVDENTSEPINNLVQQVLENGHRVANISDSQMLRSRNGDEFAIDNSVAPICGQNDEIIGAVMVLRDVTQSRELSRQLSWQASYDALTGLLNRRRFEEQLEEALFTAKTENLQHSVCFLDLDRFKAINDTCGHAAGDELLRQIGTLLQSNVRKSDLVARLGGDEFGILLYDCSIAESENLAENLCDRVESFRFSWEDRVFTVGASIGLVAIGSDSPNFSSILNAADAACYAAKNQGRGRVQVYHPSDRELMQQQRDMQWVAKIEQALLEDRFCLYYQTIMPLKPESHLRESYEVLLRLLDENGNVVLPDAFIPAAARYDRSMALDRWVIERLLVSQKEHYQQAWRSCQVNGADCFFAINLSAASIKDDQFIHFLQEQFRRHQIPPSAICFEIPEAAILGNLSRATEFFGRLKALGCRLAVDDFGGGISAFGYLKNLPVDYLKIDGKLIKDIASDRLTLAIVEMIQRLAASIEIETTAKFVADETILAKMRDIGVDYAQGYVIAEPRPL